MRIEARCGECGHEERLAQIAIALAADARTSVHRSAGSLIGRIEPAVSYPLAQACLLGQDLHCADLPYSGQGKQAQPFAMHTSFGFDPHPRLRMQMHESLLDPGHGPLQIIAHASRRRSARGLGGETPVRHAGFFTQGGHVPALRAQLQHLPAGSFPDHEFHPSAILGQSRGVGLVGLRPVKAAQNRWPFWDSTPAPQSPRLPPAPAPHRYCKHRLPPGSREPDTCSSPSLAINCRCLTAEVANWRCSSFHSGSASTASDRVAALISIPQNTVAKLLDPLSCDCLLFAHETSLGYAELRPPFRVRATGLTLYANLEYAGSQGLRFSARRSREGRGRSSCRLSSQWPQDPSAFRPKRYSPSHFDRKHTRIRGCFHAFRWNTVPFPTAVAFRKLCQELQARDTRFPALRITALVCTASP